MIPRDDVKSEAPLLNRAVDESIRSELVNLHTALPGRIETYDAATQTATITPDLKQLWVDEDEVEQEVVVSPIQDVPVMFPRAGGLSITFPVQQGDPCLLVFAERDISGWLDTGRREVPPEDRRHALSDAVALLGLYPGPEAITPAPSATELQIRSDDGLTKIELGPAGVSVESVGPINLTRGVNELLAVLSTALNEIATSTVSGVPLSNAANIAAQKGLVDAIRS